MATMQVELQKEVPWVVGCSILESVSLEMQESRWTPYNGQLAAWGAESLASLEAPPPGEVNQEQIRQSYDEEGDDQDHYHRTRIRQKEQARCCIIL